MIPLCRDEIHSSFARILAVLYSLHDFDSGVTYKKFIPTRRNRSFILGLQFSFLEKLHGSE